MRRASRLVRDALARVSREYRARVPASAPSTSAPSRALDRPDASPSRASSPSRALFASARAAMGKTKRRHPSHAPVRAEELRYDRVVAVEDASRALEPEEGTLYGTPPKTWVEREDASWDDAQAKAVDESKPHRLNSCLLNATNSFQYTRYKFFCLNVDKPSIAEILHAIIDRMR